MERAHHPRLHTALRYVAALALWNCGLAAADELEVNRAAYSQYRLAEEQISQGQYAQAIRTLSEAIALVPDTGAPLVLDRRIESRAFSAGRRLEIEQRQIERSEIYRPSYALDAARALLERQQQCALPRRLVLTWLTLSEPTGDNIVDGGETAVIALTVENRSEVDAHDIRLRTTASDSTGLTLPGELHLGTIPALNSKTELLRVRAELHIQEGTRTLRWVADEHCGFDSNPVDLTINTRPAGIPELQIEQFAIDDNTGADVRAETVAHARAVVKNTGRGVAQNVIAAVRYGENVFPAIDSPVSFRLGDLFPGESRTVEFAFVTNRRVQNGQRVPVALNVEFDSSTTQIHASLNEKIRDVPPALTYAASPATTAETGADSAMLERIPAAPVKNPKAIAVIIGNRNYTTPGMPNVDFALRDANTIRAYVEKTLGVDERNVLFYTDATSAKFNEIFGTASNPAGKLFSFVTPHESDVFIYYSGHGAPDPKSNSAYFVPVDADPSRIEFSGYALDAMYRNLGKIAARSITVVLDTCFSGNSAGGPLLNQISATRVIAAAPAASLRNAAIFTSTGPGEVSAWYTEQRHSLYTYFFLRGLSGAGDQDLDGKITSSEMQSYLSKAVPYYARRLTGQEQTPQLTQSTEQTLVRFRNPVARDAVP